MLPSGLYLSFKSTSRAQSNETPSIKRSLPKAKQEDDALKKNASLCIPLRVQRKKSKTARKKDSLQIILDKTHLPFKQE